MNACKINDEEIYAAHTRDEAIELWEHDTDYEWLPEEMTIERMSPEDKWIDEATPDIEETIADVLSRTTEPGFIGAVS